MGLNSLLGFGGYYGMMMYAGIIMAIVVSALYALPLIQGLLAYQKQNWLEKEFAKNPSSGDGENQMRAKLLAEARPSQSFPLYKMLKYYLATMGIIAVISGLLIVVLPDDLDPDLSKLLIFIPILVGIGLYFMYQKMFLGQGLYREIAASFLFLGGVWSIGGAYYLYDMSEWLRSDILIYLVLAGGLFIIHHLKSVLVSYFYMSLVVFGAQHVGDYVSYNWMLFLTNFIWVFAVAILYFWIPILKAAKKIELKEILFGVLFLYMILALTINNTAGLMVPALAVVLPGLYIFSKAYFKTADWFIAKPIEVVVILFVVAIAIALSFTDAVEMTQNYISLFEGYTFHKQVAYIVILGLGFGAYKIYETELSDSSEDSVNPLIIVFPVAAFLLTYLVGVYGTQYLIAIFGLYLGFNYVQKGIEKKDSIQLILGTITFLLVFITRFLNLLQDYLDKKIVLGLVVMFIGALLLAVVWYIRSKWLVTGVEATSTHSE